MKKTLLILALSLPLWLGMTCSPSAQTTAYNTLATTGITVNTAYTTYLNLVVTGKVATNSVPAVSQAYNDFQTAYGAALTIAQFNPNAIAPSNVVASANALVAKINLTEGKAP